MKFAFSIALAVVVTLAGMEMYQGRLHREACARFEEQISRIRSLTPHSAPRTPPSADQERLELRLAELDAELDRIAPADLGIGAPWMWTAEQRETLAGLAELVRPTLVEIVELSRERSRARTLGTHVSLL